ncbi:ATP-binding protein [Thermomonas brevis]
MTQFAADAGRPVERLSTVPWRHLAAMVIIAIAFLLALNMLMDVGARADGRDVRRFDSGVLVAADGSESGPSPLKLPANCHAVDECARTFRIKFDHDPGTQRVNHVIYVPQFTGHIQVLLNGVMLIDSTLVQTSLKLGQGAPQIASIPEMLLQPGFNEIGIELADRMGAAAVGPVFFGPESELRGEYESAYFLVVMLPRLMDGALLAIGAIMLLIWLTRRHDQLYLLCAAISLSFAISSLSPVIASALGAQLMVSMNVLRYIGACLLLPFSWQLVGRVAPIRTRWFLLPGVLMILSFHLLPKAAATQLVPVLFVPIVLMLALLALRELWRAGIRGHDRTALILLVVIAVLLLLATRDQLVTAGLLGNGHVLLARFNGPLLVLVMGMILLRRFADGLSLLEEFNERLHRDVALARTKLELAFEREKAHARQETLISERVRLMRDLHDGIAGQLMSIVALSERDTGSRAAEITRACHLALIDLRLVVDSMEDVGDDLGMMLVAFRDRIEPQLRRAGIRLDWQVRNLPNLPGLSPATTLAIFRVLQEAVNNAVRHSGSPVVEIAWAQSPHKEFGVRLLVRDHGIGGAALLHGHHGMDNMRRRAADFGARLEVASDATGTRVAVDLPRNLIRD